MLQALAIASPAACTAPGDDATARLVEALRRPSAYPHPVDRVDVVETHISYVLLAGEYAYKIKKPVRLRFLDFSTLEKRRFYCEEEVRLNRRTAPALYLDVVAIAGEPPAIGARGAPLEYAVRMRRFPQQALLDELARAGLLEERHVDRLARTVARCHEAAARAAPMDEAHAVERVTVPALDNFRDIEALEDGAAIRAALGDLGRWTRAQGEKLGRRFALRQLDGFVRECHGDLHLGNVALINEEPVPFDCIEFDAGLRSIDVMNEVAFTAMDLMHHGLPRLAARFLNGYLERIGDYAGARVLRYYLVYRAMVRAKIACVRKHEAGISAGDRAAAQADFIGHLRLARRLARPGVPALFLMHGLSGSGKTHCSQELLETLGAIRMRSDLERKRLHALSPDARTHSPPGAGLYTAEASERTYRHLAVLAHEVLAAGFPVIVDAAALLARQRALFREVARAAGARVEIVSCTAPAAMLRERLVRRTVDASEADAAVLARQLATQEPLTGEERMHCVVLDTAHPGEWQRAAATLARRFHASME